jgi:hypothetical protein
MMVMLLVGSLLENQDLVYRSSHTFKFILCLHNTRIDCCVHFVVVYPRV